MSCSKIPFYRKKEAKEFIILYNNERKKGKKKLTGFYYCKECQVYHVTSQTKQEHYEKTRNAFLPR